MLSDYYYDGDGDFYVSARDYQYLRRQEELRRRWEVEQAFRHEQELQRRRLAHEQELARRQRREQALEERRRMVEAQDALTQKRLLAQQSRRQQQKPPSPYKLVIGSDGFLYRVPVVEDERQILVKKDNLVASSDSFVSIDNSEKRMKEVKKNKLNKAQKKYQVESPQEAAVQPSDNDSGNVTVTVKLPEKKKDLTKAGRRRVTVVVEDASDSESDVDDFKSIWRNRRPSPGEWIEPVEEAP